MHSLIWLLDKKAFHFKWLWKSQYLDVALWPSHRHNAIFQTAWVFPLPPPSLRPWQKRHVVPLAIWFGGFMKGEAGMRAGSCSMRGFNEQNVVSAINILPSSRLVPHSQWRPPSFIKSSAFPPLSGPLLLRHDWRGGRVGNTDADQTPPDAKDTRRLCRSQGPLCVCVCLCVQGCVCLQTEAVRHLIILISLHVVNTCLSLSGMQM